MNFEQALRAVRTSDLSANQIAFLEIVHTQTNTSPDELARRLGVSSASISNAGLHLMRLGLVTQKRNPLGDARCVTWSGTPRGLAVLRSLTPS